MPDTISQTVTEIDFHQPMAAAPAPVVPTTHHEVSVVENVTPVLSMIERASRDPAVDIDKMERLILMQERMQAKAAQVEFDNAMADAQEAMKPVRADLDNKQTRSKYASYAALDKAIRPIYAKHGFAVSFNTGDAPRPDEVRVLATVSHRGGHRQDYKIDMPADGKGPQGASVMTRTHATGAAASYGQRYLYKLIFNLAVGDVDDDGNGASGDWVDEAERDGLLRDGERRSTYNVENARRAQEWADNAIQALNFAPNPEAAREWRRLSQEVPPRKKKSPLQWLQDNSPGQYSRVANAYENATGEGLE